MKKEKSTKTISGSLFSSKKNIVIACVIAVIVIVLVAISMIIESSYGKFIVNNETDMNLEYVKTSFINAEQTIDNGLQTGSIEANDTLTTDIEPVSLLYTESNLEVRFKFENKEVLFTDAGLFNSNFNGNIKIDFIPTKDPNLVTLKIQAKNGFFKSKTINCNEEYTIDLSAGKILE